MVNLADDLRLALDRVEFARHLGIEPDPWQEQLLRSESDRTLLLCSRQAGKSAMAGIRALHRALYYPNSLVLVLAPSERQSKELFAKVAAGYRALGHTVPAGSDRKLGMELANGSRIEALPGSEKTVRGFSGVDLLILDEAARVDDELVFAVRPMIATSGGSLLMLTTPWGKRGVFHQEWTEGLGWERYEVPATSIPRITHTFLEQERRALPDRMFRQEFLCEFVETDDQVFSFEEIQSAMSDEVEPLFGGPFEEAS